MMAPAARKPSGRRRSLHFAWFYEQFCRGERAPRYIEGYQLFNLSIESGVFLGGNRHEELSELSAAAPYHVESDYWSNSSRDFFSYHCIYTVGEWFVDLGSPTLSRKHRKSGGAKSEGPARVIG